MIVRRDDLPPLVGIVDLELCPQAKRRTAKAEATCWR
jgi:hypothetical protein